MKFRNCVLAIALAAVASLACAQTAPAPIQNLYGLGLSYNTGVTGPQSVAGTALYAHYLTGSSYAFTAIDAVPATVSPFTVTTNVGIGVAQKVATIAGADIFVPTAAGFSFNGQNAGWQWNTGAMAVFHVKSNYYLMPSVRFLKSSVSGGSGVQPIVGVSFGWGK